MDDRTLVNTGMAYSEKTMETADDVIQARMDSGMTIAQW